MGDDTLRRWILLVAALFVSSVAVAPMASAKIMYPCDKTLPCEDGDDPGSIDLFSLLKTIVDVVTNGANQPLQVSCQQSAFQGLPLESCSEGIV